MAAPGSTPMVGFERPARERVLSWFKGNSDNPGIEVEARIKDVSQLGFETVLRNLASNKGWSNTPKERTTLDLIHASGVRETHDDAQKVSFMRKERHEQFNCECGTSGYEVRFAVASETEDRLGFQDTSEVSTWRYKQRIQFVHKGLFAFDLTKVKQGATQQLAKQAETTYEIEVEFCGQKEAIAAKEQQKATYLTDSMLMKARLAPPALPSRMLPPLLSAPSGPRHPSPLTAHASPLTPSAQVADLVRQLVAASAAAVSPCTCTCGSSAYSATLPRSPCTAARGAPCSHPPPLHRTPAPYPGTVPLHHTPGAPSSGQAAARREWRAADGRARESRRGHARRPRACRAGDARALRR